MTADENFNHPRGIIGRSRCQPCGIDNPYCPHRNSCNWEVSKPVAEVAITPLQAGF